jgi:hypothetical protein
MSKSELDKYAVDHLFLLIGENVLPNYVAVKLLLKKGGTAYLVHTSGTQSQANRLSDVLKSEGSQSIQLVPLEEYESDAFHIQRILTPFFPRSGYIGMNYTGGTKAMAVHAYRKVLETYKDDAVFSYLDARRLEMCIDRQDGERIRIKVKPGLLDIKLETVFHLHGLRLKSTPKQTPQLPELANELAKVFYEGENRKVWLSWYYDEFCSRTKKKTADGTLGSWIEKDTHLENVIIPCNGLLPTILESFRNLEFLDADGYLSLQRVKEAAIFEKLKHFCKWLDGVWLEHYVLHQVELVVKEIHIADYGMSFNVPLSGTKEGFEFDVALTHGYQLFAISCSTTSDRKLCKSKLFEAYLRAQQMGGSEARVALVCCSNEPDSLKAEIATLVGSSQVQVFGADSLLNLDQKITTWIQEAST